MSPSDRSPFDIALCNEVIAELAFDEACTLAAELGYDALEVAPFTLADDPARLDERTCRAARRAAEAAGIRISGLHWLLVAPAGLSITSPDGGVRRRTLDTIERLVHACAALGGSVLVHGSPKQRELGDDPEGDRERGVAAFAAAAGFAEAAGVTYCIEPLAAEETSFVTSVAEAAAIVERVGSPALRTMIDARAARLSEREPVEELVARWLPPGTVAHVHVNDTTKLAPGQGRDAFAPLLAALAEHDYRGVVAVEPFDYRPDGPGAAARAIGYLQGILETLAFTADTGRVAAPHGGPPRA